MRRPIPWVELLVLNGLVAASLWYAVAERYPRWRHATITNPCLSNLKQIVTATLVYAADHDGLWPPSIASEPQVGQHPNVRDATFPWLKNDAVWLCSRWDEGNHRRLVSYHPNGNLFTRRGLDGKTITRPEITVAYREAYNRRRYATAICRPYQQEDRPGPANDDFHPEGLGCYGHGGMFAFADGHAKWEPAEWYQAANLGGPELRLVP